jgi:FkbM family methyltransferase
MVQAKTNAIQNLSILLSRQRWLPYKTRRSLVKRLHPLMLRDFPFEIPFYDPAWGLKFHGNTVYGADRVVYFCGAHKKYLLSMLCDYTARLRAHSSDPLISIDVGAGSGNYSLFMSKLADEVHAFEPYERARRQLDYNLSLNHVGNVMAYPVGLGERDEVVPFYDTPEKKCAQKDSYHLGNLPLRAGDGLMAALGINAVSIAKVDVGGQEVAVLRGLAQTLKRDRPLVLLDVSPEMRGVVASRGDLAALLPDHYRFYRFAAANPNNGTYRLAPFMYDESPKWSDIIACPAEKLSFLSV